MSENTSTTCNYLVVEEYLEKGKEFFRLRHPVKWLTQEDEEKFLLYCQLMTRRKVDMILTSNSKVNLKIAIEAAIAELNPIETIISSEAGSVIKCVVPQPYWSHTFFRNQMPIKKEK
ncbi:MAG: hypothetical protein ACD_3C00169G0007 [uncultured bacterium (gcode 4)]|uniref:Uncharacterized protein n=1 Tax=uncultured bacterium (gcode 4) TaxID=1234023 RepID=K2G0N0_9BACT|nr:MAG: hypothetical protein ACD_3C00169G0007 [uncultured bacterium (gcode 4)]